MGMFDTVVASCPKCGREVEFQSKAGECVLRRYGINSVPPEIALDLEGELQSCDCGEVLRITSMRPIERVQMRVDDGSKDWD